ncbi:MAG: aminopeptidase [Gammaproteobacteria bacterium]|nr:aminopeptidase [Gammaproteobacteria bacterium]
MCRGRSAPATLILLAANLAGCATAGYFGQAISGHLRLLHERQNIETVMRDPALPAALRSRLEAVAPILAFAADRLGLPARGNYRTFVQLKAPYVTWNVFATPALSFSACQWCYPVVGCFPYRGYFSEAAAQAEAGRLRAAGRDVFVGGIAAYSTLGWSDDPVLSSMLRGEKPELAALLFHELAHVKYWVRGDAELSEAFAEAVARIGTEMAAAEWPDGDLGSYRLRMQQEDEFFALVLTHKRQLQALYESALPEAEKRILKQRQFESLRADYRELKSRSGDPGRFDAWLASDLNNARLVAVSAYRELVPGLLDIFRRGGNDLEEFYKQAEILRRCAPEARRAWVLSGGILPPCVPVRGNR